MSTLLVDSGYPALPFYVNQHGIDSNRSITLVSGSAAVEAGTILSPSGSTGKFHPWLSGETAAGILFDYTDVTAGDVIAAMFVHGLVRSGSLSVGSGSLATAIGQLGDEILFV